MIVMAESIGTALSEWMAQQEAARKERENREAEVMMKQEHKRRMAEEPQTEEEKERAKLAKIGVETVNTIFGRVLNDMHKAEKKRQLLEIPAVYHAHSKLFLQIANKVLAYQHRAFVIDDNNREVLRFLLYYFNDCPLAEEVFPGRGYKLHKHIMLQGNVGTGKTLLMEIFSEYLRYTGNPNFFYNLSVTQMINYYTLHNNLDRYTFNEEENKGFQCKPVNICLNDIGVQTTTFYGMDTKVLTDEFLHARNEIWSQFHLKAHVTTNLSIEQLKEKYKDGFGRLIDRFKTYNVIPLGGNSRR